MNRLLLIPALVFAAGFAGWCLLAPPESPEDSKSENNQVLPGFTKTMTESPDLDRLANETQQVVSRLNDAWEQATARSAGQNDSLADHFSRKAIEPSTAPSIGVAEFDDFGESSTEVSGKNGSGTEISGLLVGRFVVTGKETRTFPLVVNRQTGSVSVYAERIWHPFDQWVVSQTSGANGAKKRW